jgi:DNA-binding NtrC family response regulator
MNRGNILIIDDEEPQRTVLAGYLRKKGFEIATAESADAGVAIFESQSVDLVLTDYRMPGGTGLDVLHAVKKINPSVPLILITAYGNIEGAVEAMRDGAFDYISKPVKLNMLTEVVEKALEQHQIYLENQTIIDPDDGTFHLEGLVADSSVMQTALNVSARAAQSDATVLILGETGTGKEVIARAIHKASLRSKKAFLAVNCGALAEGLLESELFGHEKGAFTDASTRRIGRCFSTKWVIFQWDCRSNCCVCFKKESFSGWAAMKHCKQMYVLLRPRFEIWIAWFEIDLFGKICFTG